MYIMFKLPWKAKNKVKFERKILRKNDISLLILDERWNKLFETTEKTPQISACEIKLRELLKEEARLLNEAKVIAENKKKCMDRIINLTPAVFEKNDNKAAEEMQQLEKEIKKINERSKKIEEQLEEHPDKIKQTNLELLEHTVNVVYFKMRSCSKRVEELTSLIEDTKAKLMQYIDEKESLAQDDTDIYSYFHDLLGGEELERLDQVFFGDDDSSKKKELKAESTNEKNEGTEV
jgi:chromosome segregation ATPase